MPRLHIQAGLTNKYIMILTCILLCLDQVSSMMMIILTIRIIIIILTYVLLHFIHFTHYFRQTCCELID